MEEHLETSYIKSENCTYYREREGTPDAFGNIHFYFSVVQLLFRGGEIFRTRPDRPWGLHSVLYNGYRVFPGVKRPGRGADNLPHLSDEGKKE
jgi:hypothetical protein